VRVAQRQALLADVSQRAAMRGLADALAEETRSASLAQRSRALTQSYGGRSQAQDGAGLEHAARFAGALARLANEAEAARADAVQQSDWQAQSLGQAQTRARRQAERLADAVTAYKNAKERRDHDPAQAATGAKSSGASKRLAHPVQGEDPKPLHAQTPSSRTAQ